MPACVVTTIQPPTAAMRSWAALLSSAGGSPFIVIGDRKGPDSFDLPGATFYSLSDQMRLDLELARLLPAGHYARKNLGYLLAMRQAPACIFETDDDNAPAGWFVPELEITAREVSRDQPGWVNVYHHFTNEKIWPRGLPLDRIDDHGTTGPKKTGPCPIQQSLADGSPDVDAVWRLTQDRPITFDQNAPVRLLPGAWCPFNSQCTWWWKAAWPLMYLPTHCTFRMTDIWRSLIAQRCLWAMGQCVAFLPPQVRQDRNAHDLMRDFADEVPGYLKNDLIAKVLMDTPLDGHDVRANLISCYETLIREQIVPREEMALVRAWVADCQSAK